MTRGGAHRAGAARGRALTARARPRAAAAAAAAAFGALGLLGGCGTAARPAHPPQPRTVTVTATTSATAVTTETTAPSAPSAPTAPTAPTAPGAQPTSDWMPPGVVLPHPPGASLGSILARGVYGGWRDPANAVRAFALVYSNWTAASVVLHLRTLALDSVDQARSLVELQAAEAGRDYELQRAGIANAATVESIAPAPGAAGSWIVVTRERTTSSRTSAYTGLAAAWHVTLASVAEVDGVWVVSRWQALS